MGPFFIFWHGRQLRELASLRAKTKPGYYSQAGFSAKPYRRGK